MATASIQSLRNGLNPVTGASRDDLVLGDTVTVSSVNAGLIYAWTIVFRPEGSSAVFSSTGLITADTQNPGTFTVDVEGPYLIRLMFTDGTGTTEQFVRLRALTTLGSLKLVAAGEKYGIIPVPVDATIVGWAYDQNYNLNQILGLIGGGFLPTTVKSVFAYSMTSPITVTALNPGDVVISIYLKILTAFNGTAPEILIGTPATPDLFQASGDNDPTMGDTVFQTTPMEEIGAATTLEVSLSGLSGATQGTALMVALVHRD